MDAITVTVLPDGSVKIETDPISPANHRSADDLVRFLEDALAGDVVRRKRLAPTGAKVHVRHHAT